MHMKKLNLKINFNFLRNKDKEALEKWRHLEFAMKTPTEEESASWEKDIKDIRAKQYEINYKNWTAGL